MFLIPPVTTVWGAVMFAEPFTAATMVGLTLALTATWIVTRAPRVHPAPTPGTAATHTGTAARADQAHERRNDPRDTPASLGPSANVSSACRQGQEFADGVVAPPAPPRGAGRSLKGAAPGNPEP